jgi:energy-coupling factor transporter ATP-binding protein EcfA2
VPAAGDNPIDDPTADRLGRRVAAEHLAADLRDVDASEGYVVAVTGPWGSGKTSLVNMIRKALADRPELPVTDFNPWMFSGASQLVEFFFQELSAQLRIKGGSLAKIASDVEAYGELLSPIALLPVIGDWFDRARQTAGKFKRYQEHKRGSVTDQRKKLAEVLGKLAQPLVVVIDDIDRLETGEIRDIFKLVRLTASFPNVIYLLAFDRERVEQALTETGFDGRAYLEKIVQLGVEIPAIPDTVLVGQLTEALDAAINDLGVPERFNAAAWPDVLAEIIFPLVDTMRDVRRYAAAVRATTRALAGEVELVDVMALEAVRVFLPGSFTVLAAAREGMTSTSDALGGSQAKPQLKAQVDAFIDSDAEHTDVLRDVITRLFPGARHFVGGSHYGSEWLKTWIKDRRVAHPDILALYLERVANPQIVAFGHAEQFFVALSDRAALEALAAEYDVDTTRDVVNSLESFEHDFPREGVVPGSIVLLNLLPGLPEREVGMFSIGARTAVIRVVLRLLRRMSTQAEVRAAVEAILPEVTSLSAKLDLIRILSYGGTDEEKLVAPADAQSFGRAFVVELEAASSERLARENDVIRLLLAPKHLFDDHLLHVSPDDKVLARQVLIAARSEVRGQTIGNRSVQRTYRLPWDLLIDIFEGEDRLRMAVDDLRTLSGKDMAELSTLADKYLGGWRPHEFEDG